MKRQNGFLIALVLCFISTLALAASNFPGSLDSYSTKSSGDTIAEGHINDPQDAIEAIEAKVGTGASTPADTMALIGTGAGTSAWGDVPMDAGGTGASLSNDPGGLLYCGASVLAVLANDAASGKVLLSGGTSTPTWGTRVQKATGEYTGDGNATQAITGVGFQPKYLMIYCQVSTKPSPFLKTDQDSTYCFYDQGSDMYYEVDYIISLDADGFTVGDGTGGSTAEDTNVTSRVYTYIAETF